MSNYITIDGGTTNTRISLVRNYKIVETLKFNIGARAGIEDRELLKNTIKDRIKALLSSNNLKENDIERILASGMITSEYGILNLEHIVVPAGIEELAKGSCEIELNDISSIKFVFMRGVKTVSEKLEGADMMRGEETELMGIIKPDDGECVCILPGSHSKIIKTDKNGRIEYFTTMLTGEMIASLSGNTILKASVNLSSNIDEEYLFCGFEYCREKGINEALFKARILKNLFSAEDDRVYSFFMGAVLSGEILAVLKMNAKKIVIGGKKQLKEATKILLSKTADCEIICVPDSDVDKSSVLGMIKIYEHKVK